MNISEARRGGAAFACLSSSPEWCVHLESVCQGLRSKAPPQVLATVCFFNSDGLQIRGRAVPPGRPAPQGFQQIGRSLLTRRQRVCLWQRPSRLGESSSVAWVQQWGCFRGSSTARPSHPQFNVLVVRPFRCFGSWGCWSCAFGVICSEECWLCAFGGVVLYLTADLGRTLPGWHIWTASFSVWESWWVGMEGMSRRGLCGSSVHEFRDMATNRGMFMQLLVGVRNPSAWTLRSFGSFGPAKVNSKLELSNCCTANLSELTPW